MAKHDVPGNPIAGHKVGFVAGALGERVTINRRHIRLESGLGMRLRERKEVGRKFGV